MDILFPFFWLTIYPRTLCCQRIERYKKGEKRKNKYYVATHPYASLGSLTPSHMAAQVQSLSSPQRLLWIAKKPSLWDTGIFCFLVMRLIMLTAIYSSFLPHLQTPNNLANHSKQTFFLLSLLYLLYLENPLKNNSVQHWYLVSLHCQQERGTLLCSHDRLHFHSSLLPSHWSYE